MLCKKLLSVIALVSTSLISYGQSSRAQVTLTTSNLPIVKIKTTNAQPVNNDVYIDATMGVIDYGPGVTNRVIDPINDYDGKIGIKTRGSWTLRYPQKSYNVKTWDLQKVDLNYELMGMPSEHKWALYAPYDDYTFLANPLAFQLSREMGHWAPRTRFCEVLLDTGFGYDYNGIYVMMEKIKRDPNRADIARLDFDDNAGDSLTGGYIIAVDENINDSNPQGFDTKNSPRVFITYKYPKGDNITNQQKAYIQSYIDTVENSLLAANFSDLDNGYRKYLDEYSFIDFFIIQELSKNLDGFKRSAYLYKDKYSKGGKLHAGPQWDFNAAWGNSKYIAGLLGVCGYDEPEGWVHTTAFCWIHTTFPVPFWWERLLEDPEFVHRLKCRWMQLRQTTLSKSHIFGLIDSMETEASSAAVRQFTRFDFNYTLSERTDLLKTWLGTRIDWMDVNMPGECLDISIDESVAFDDSFSIYPNPVKDMINIELNLSNGGNIGVTLVDALGRTLHSLHEQNYSVGVHQLQIPASRFSSGIYYIKFQSGISVSVKKIVVTQ